MKRFNQRGFHLLYVVPLVAIVAVVAVVGVKVSKPSHAETAFGVSCSMIFPVSQLSRGATRSAIFSVKNNNSTTISNVRALAGYSAGGRSFSGVSGYQNIAKGGQSSFSAPVKNQVTARTTVSLRGQLDFTLNGKAYAISACSTKSVLML